MYRAQLVGKRLIGDRARLINSGARKSKPGIKLFASH